MYRLIFGIWVVLHSAALSAQQYKQDFINLIKPMALEQERLYGIPASLTIAQAITETGWGKSRLFREGNNAFGIAKIVYADGSEPTYEEYSSLEECFDKRLDVIMLERYKGLDTCLSVECWANVLVDNGWAYSYAKDYWMKIIRQNNLDSITIKTAKNDKDVKFRNYIINRSGIVSNTKPVKNRRAEQLTGTGTTTHAGRNRTIPLSIYGRCPKISLEIFRHTSTNRGSNSFLEEAVTCALPFSEKGSSPNSRSNRYSKVHACLLRNLGRYGRMGRNYI